MTDHYMMPNSEETARLMAEARRMRARAFAGLVRGVGAAIWAAAMAVAAAADDAREARARVARGGSARA